MYLFITYAEDMKVCRLGVLELLTNLKKIRCSILERWRLQLVREGGFTF